MLPSRLPGSGAHWVDHVARHAHTIPDSVAIRFMDESITWAQLHGRVQRLAAAFAERGVSRGDRVAILMTNRPEFLEATLAANAVGAIAVPVNFRLAPAEAAYVLQDSGATLVVTDSLLSPLAAGWTFRTRRGVRGAGRTKLPGDSGGGSPDTAVALPTSPGHPRADLYKELDDMGL